MGAAGSEPVPEAAAPAAAPVPSSGTAREGSRGQISDSAESKTGSGGSTMWLQFRSPEAHAALRW
ncbi:hypothetical protein PF008_g11068 [Phytophthora fragariae]|uniref:Uncharacterized protein n=1 Tax=Phytophthora fragariae TaxID=53985 RepID=A0A6G0RSE9_9STRA|nr:hypothetical protein PF008_g11068 [Phytophthora fragariae]